MKTPASDKPEQEAVAESDEKVLRLSQVFDATRETLFAAFTDPTILVCWWGPEGVSIPECRIDLRVGGAWRTCMQGTECEDRCVGGVYKEILPSEKLVFTWAWDKVDGVGDETLITLEFLERDEGCELRFTQEGFADSGIRGRHLEGWSSSFICLRKFLAGEDTHS